MNPGKGGKKKARASNAPIEHEIKAFDLDSICAERERNHDQSGKGSVK